MRVSGFSRRLTFSPSHIRSATTINAAGDQENVFAEIVFGGMFQQFARNGSGNRRRRQKPQKQALFFLLVGGEVRVGTAGFGEANDLSSERGADDLKPGAPEIEEHREQSPEVKGYVESSVRGRAKVRSSPASAAR